MAATKSPACATSSCASDNYNAIACVICQQPRFVRAVQQAPHFLERRSPLQQKAAKCPYQPPVRAPCFRQCSARQQSRASRIKHGVIRPVRSTICIAQFQQRPRRNTCLHSLCHQRIRIGAALAHSDTPSRLILPSSAGLSAPSGCSHSSSQTGSGETSTPVSSMAS